jgi:hypothetical protein
MAGNKSFALMATSRFDNSDEKGDFTHDSPVIVPDTLAAS